MIELNSRKNDVTGLRADRIYKWYLKYPDFFTTFN